MIQPNIVQLSPLNAQEWWATYKPAGTEMPADLAVAYYAGQRDGRASQPAQGGVREAVIEECARVCDEKARGMLACAEHGDARTCWELAAAIRALADVFAPTLPNE